MSIWILTEEHNDYDQHGEYFLTAWIKKPSKKEVSNHINLQYNQYNMKEYIDHVYRGGGQIDTEDIWYYLQEIEEGQ